MLAEFRRECMHWERMLIRRALLRLGNERKAASELADRIKYLWGNRGGPRNSVGFPHCTSGLSGLQSGLGTFGMTGLSQIGPPSFRSVGIGGLEQGFQMLAKH